MEKTSPLNLERYELKFLIPHDLLEPLSQYAEQYCRLDPYAEADTMYTINTLYLDSPQFIFYRRRLNGEDRRFTMRLRSYGPEPKAPYFAEIKFKQNGVVRKFRHPLTESDWQTAYAWQTCADPFICTEALQSKNYALFARLLTSYNAEPKVLTQYRRKAYISTVDDYARVTFDTNLRFQNENCFNLTPDDCAMSHYDNPTIFPEGCDVILELKSTTRVPLWMMDMIKSFDLHRSRFSKYANSLGEVLSSHYHTPRMERVYHQVFRT